MRRTHSQVITITDDTRANASMVPALIVGLVIVVALGFNPLEGSSSELTDLGETLIALFLIGWPLFGLIYLLWTHVGLQELDETDLIVHARWATARRRSLWSKAFGSGGAVSWATLAAFVAVMFNIILVTTGPDGNVLVTAGLGLLNVVASWAVMVYSFALEYMRLDLRGGGSDHARQLEFDMDESRKFSDYLTFSALSSTMTAALPGKAVTREGWRLVRSNVIVAFAFNSVVVATLVSMILSYLMA